jgi:hypothetical protein
MLIRSVQPEFYRNNWRMILNIAMLVTDVGMVGPVLQACDRKILCVTRV